MPVLIRMYRSTGVKDEPSEKLAFRSATFEKNKEKRKVYYLEERVGMKLANRTLPRDGDTEEKLIGLAAWPWSYCC